MRGYIYIKQGPSSSDPLTPTLSLSEREFVGQQ